ncbi:putative FLYWCH zinc finger domain-containing protein 1 [Homarus americanus]|uniref:Putative FLYWCH zinc finger domain-containing protein 1 n=1 Tax=Homarus americanus TaxID=6706 RepID=A0A8J5JIK5_HOMAM|nr:putative FLYWCH zinc finger domain-containing protein 1 [Homarus americanus]
MPHVITSTRGREKLVDDMNYIYGAQKRNAYGSKTYWKCEVKCCKARIHTLTQDEDYGIIKRVGDHHHSSSVAKPKVRKQLADLKVAAISSQECPRSLIAATSANLDENEMAELPSTSCLSRNIRKWRQGKVSAPPIPQNLSGYKISVE